MILVFFCVSGVVFCGEDRHRFKSGESFFVVPIFDVLDVSHFLNIISVSVALFNASFLGLRYALASPRLFHVVISHRFSRLVV